MKSEPVAAAVPVARAAPETALAVPAFRRELTSNERVRGWEDFMRPARAVVSDVLNGVHPDADKPYVEASTRVRVAVDMVKVDAAKMADRERGNAAPIGLIVVPVRLPESDWEAMARSADLGSPFIL